MTRRTAWTLCAVAVALTAATVLWTLTSPPHPLPPDPTRTILVTGFGPFGKVETNPAWESVRSLHGAVVGRSRIRVARIDVVYANAGPQLQEAIERTRPDLVLSLGVAPGQEIRIETTARNRDTARAPDNAGIVREDVAIREDGAPTVPTRLPVEALLRALREDGYPVRASDDAGGYLCNHLFYEMLHVVPPGTPCGFVHVPEMGGPWDLDRLRAAVWRILEVLDAVGAEEPAPA